MPLPLLVRALPLPEALGLWDGSLFAEYPLTLEGLDPAFTLPPAVVLAQGALLAAGAGPEVFSAGKGYPKGEVRPGAPPGERRPPWSRSTHSRQS